MKTLGAFVALQKNHNPLILAYEKIRADTEKRTSNQEILEVALFLINCIVGLRGLCTAFLVFSSLPRLARITPTASEIDRAHLLDKFTKAVRKDQARKRIAFPIEVQSKTKRVVVILAIERHTSWISCACLPISY